MADGPWLIATVTATAPVPVVGLFGRIPVYRPNGPTNVHIYIQVASPANARRTSYPEGVLERNPENGEQGLWRKRPLPNEGGRQVIKPPHECSLKRLFLALHMLPLKRTPAEEEECA